MVVSRYVHVAVQPESPELEAYARTAESAIRVSAKRRAKWRIDRSAGLWADSISRPWKRGSETYSAALITMPAA